MVRLGPGLGSVWVRVRRLGLGLGSVRVKIRVRVMSG